MEKWWANGMMMGRRSQGKNVEEVINKTKKETPKNKSKHWYSIRALLLPAIPEYPLEQARIHVAPLSSELQLCHVAVAYSQSVEHSIDLQQTVSLAVSFRMFDFGMHYYCRRRCQSIVDSLVVSFVWYTRRQGISEGWRWWFRRFRR